jgi:hypothetical protein
MSNRQNTNQDRDLRRSTAAKVGANEGWKAGSDSCMPIDESDRADLRQALHTINNSLHVLGLQTELARLHIGNGNVDEARAALDLALRERNACGDTMRTLQKLIQAL